MVKASFHDILLHLAFLYALAQTAWLAKREEFMNAAKAVADDRKPFEESIKRTYFHVKPLDASQVRLMSCC